MKRISLNILILVLVFSLGKLKAQEAYPAENLSMWADRAMYISGESILFAGAVSMNNSSEILSKVIYAELISPEGQKINKIKIPINKSFFEGEIKIPDDVISGNYYLRAYTKWMRNGSPKDYEYVLLKIINPYNKEVLSINDSLILEDSLLTIIPNDEKLKMSECLEGGDFIVDLKSMNSKIYSLSIIPELCQAQTYHIKKTQNTNYPQINYYPETRGLSISGKILNVDKPSPYHRLNVSLLGKKDFISVMCDSLGQFNISLPIEYLNHELFLIAEEKKGVKAKILIDQDFCSEDIQVPTPVFFLNGQEKDLVLKMAKNSQIIKTFYPKKELERSKKDIIPFYGSVSKTIVFDKYITLDSLQLYFTDIPSGVSIHKSKGRRTFRLMGEQYELSLYPPLMLVDWVPVNQAEKLLAMSPSLIKKIDILNKSYLHGDQIYGGIIHIQTHKGDFGNVKFDESGQYLKFDFFSVYLHHNMDVNPFVNTVLWKTFQDDIGKAAKVNCPQIYGDYILQYQGIDNKGESFKISKKINVSKSK